MKVVDGHYAMTAHELGRELLECTEDAIVTVGISDTGDATFTIHSIYKMEIAANETEACLFSSPPLPRQYEIRDRFGPDGRPPRPTTVDLQSPAWDSIERGLTPEQ